jgi:gamma-glutamyltranspeptidase / glutathione hydrolase
MTSRDSESPLHTLANSPSGFTTRPVIMGTHGMVTSGHYLASRIGLSILEGGGNAVDAAVAMGFALSVLEPHLYGIGGEVPVLIYLAAERRVVSLSGQGPAPRAATIEWFRGRGIDMIPGNGLLAATVPAAVDTWIFALSRFGTMALSQVLAEVIELAEKGFPMYHGLQWSIMKSADRFRAEWPTTAEVFLPGDKVPEIGERLMQAGLARTLKRLVEAEHRALKQGREEALQAARDEFYRGNTAESIVRFTRENKFPDASGRSNSGLLDRDDLMNYSARVEAPVSITYRGYDVYKCGPWTQGPVFLQQLNLLEGCDLASLGHNSPAYIHLLAETTKLAFADREFFYGDPDFVSVPLGKLLSKEYAADRRRMIDPDHASLELRPGSSEQPELQERKGHEQASPGDTTHLDAADRWGNLLSATPSGGWISSSPLIKGLGFPLGTRLQMFYLNPSHANALLPGKRPRTTLTPSLVLKDGAPYLAFGTPGGDQQDQWSLQFFLNHVDFEMNIQEAADAPNFHTAHFPSSFYPHAADPGSLVLESRIPESTRGALRAKGHKVKITGDWSNGRVLAIRIDTKNRILSGAASARMETGYAMGW